VLESNGLQGESVEQGIAAVRMDLCGGSLRSLAAWPALQQNSEPLERASHPGEPYDIESDTRDGRPDVGSA
jgi:hypothetical protein